MIVLASFIGALLGGFLAMHLIDAGERAKKDARRKREKEWHAKYKSWRAAFPPGRIDEAKRCFVDGPYAGSDYVEVMKWLGQPMPKFEE